ncbi:hypothetical protein [Spirosoma profusum]|nr:hypothetical protein [Spirosoma profusum]
MLRRKPTFYRLDRGISRVGATCQIRFFGFLNGAFLVFTGAA